MLDIQKIILHAVNSDQVMTIYGDRHPLKSILAKYYDDKVDFYNELFLCECHISNEYILREKQSLSKEQCASICLTN